MKNCYELPVKVTYTNDGQVDVAKLESGLATVDLDKILQKSSPIDFHKQRRVRRFIQTNQGSIGTVINNTPLLISKNNKQKITNLDETEEEDDYDEDNTLPSKPLETTTKSKKKSKGKKIFLNNEYYLDEKTLKSIMSMLSSQSSSKPTTTATITPTTTLSTTTTTSSTKEDNVNSFLLSLLKSKSETDPVVKSTKPTKISKKRRKQKKKVKSLWVNPNKNLIVCLPPRL